MLVLIQSYYGFQSVGTRFGGGVEFPRSNILMVREYYTTWCGILWVVGDVVNLLHLGLLIGLR